jgi:hypothetical protein
MTGWSERSYGVEKNLGSTALNIRAAEYDAGKISETPMHQKNICHQSGLREYKLVEHHLQKERQKEHISERNVQGQRQESTLVETWQQCHRGKATQTFAEASGCAQ